MALARHDSKAKQIAAWAANTEALPLYPSCNTVVAPVHPPVCSKMHNLFLHLAGFSASCDWGLGTPDTIFWGQRARLPEQRQMLEMPTKGPRARRPAVGGPFTARECQFGSASQCNNTCGSGSVFSRGGAMAVVCGPSQRFAWKTPRPRVEVELTSFRP